MTAPRVRFLIGGVQKAGTSALAHYLARQPGLRLPVAKEAHVFDAPDFDEAWTPAQIDARYAGQYADEKGLDADPLHGDATPIYLLHPRLIRRIARYNPDMRWIVLLRDPVERALSHYHMERARGNERWPLWAALLLERWRLHGHADDFGDGSPLRHHSYRLRGDYAGQLDALHACFPREQVLLLRSEALLQDPAACVAEACRWLGVPAPGPDADYPKVFEGAYRQLAAASPTRALLRYLLRAELAALRKRYGIVFH